MDRTQRVWQGIVSLFAIFSLAGPAAMLGQSLESASAKPGDVVTMARLQFSPAVLQVPKGAVVTFVNADVAPHTVTQDAGGVPPRTDSGILKPRQTFELTVSGPLVYHCEIHPGMHARIEMSG